MFTWSVLFWNHCLSLWSVCPILFQSRVSLPQWRRTSPRQPNEWTGPEVGSRTSLYREAPMCNYTLCRPYRVPSRLNRRQQDLCFRNKLVSQSMNKQFSVNKTYKEHSSSVQNHILCRSASWEHVHRSVRHASSPYMFRDVLSSSPMALEWAVNKSAVTGRA